MPATFMLLAAGTRLGPYEIMGAAGAGGMGEVYRARDTRADALFNRAIAAGAKVAPGPMGQMRDQFWGDRCGTVVDPAGYHWTIATRKEDLTPQELKQRELDFFI